MPPNRATMEPKKEEGRAVCGGEAVPEGIRDQNLGKGLETEPCTSHDTSWSTTDMGMTLEVPLSLPEPVSSSAKWPDVCLGGGPVSL